MKRFLALALTAAMALSLAGCNSAAPPSSSGSGSTGPVSSSQPPADSTNNGVISSVVDLNTDWLPYDSSGSLKLTDRDADGMNGVVSSANYYASKIGTQIIEDGGNAIDAAVAVGFAMSTVESYYSGLGGGGYMLIRFADTG